MAVSSKKYNTLTILMATFSQHMNFPTDYFREKENTNIANEVESFELKAMRKSNERRLLSSNHSGPEYIKYATANANFFTDNGKVSTQKNSAFKEPKISKSTSLPLDFHRETILNYYENFDKYRQKNCTLKERKENIIFNSLFKRGPLTSQNTAEEQRLNSITTRKKLNFAQSSLPSKEKIPNKTFQKQKVREYLKLIKKINKLNLRFGNDWQSDEWNSVDFRICKRNHGFREIDQQFEKLNSAIEKFIGEYGYPTEELIINACDIDKNSYKIVNFFHENKYNPINRLIVSLEEKINLLSRIVYHKRWLNFIENEVGLDESVGNISRENNNSRLNKPVDNKLVANGRKTADIRDENEPKRKGRIISTIYKLQIFITFYFIHIPKCFFQKLFSNIRDFFKKEKPPTTSSNGGFRWGSLCSIF